MIDDLLFLEKKRVRSGTARVYHGGYTRLQSDVRRNSKRCLMGASLWSKPVKRRASVSDVEVNIDKTGRHVKPRSVDDLGSLTGGNVFFHCRNFVLRNRDVHH